MRRQVNASPYARPSSSRSSQTVKTPDAKTVSPSLLFPPRIPPRCFIEGRKTADGEINWTAGNLPSAEQTLAIRIKWSTCNSASEKCFPADAVFILGGEGFGGRHIWHCRRGRGASFREKWIPADPSSPHNVFSRSFQRADVRMLAKQEESRCIRDSVPASMNMARGDGEYAAIRRIEATQAFCIEFLEDAINSASPTDRIYCPKVRTVQHTTTCA